MLKPITAYGVTLKAAKDAVLDLYPSGPSEEQEKVVEDRVKTRTGVLTH